jgi:hypothetical protein
MALRLSGATPTLLLAIIGTLIVAPRDMSVQTPATPAPRGGAMAAIPPAERLAAQP